MKKVTGFLFAMFVLCAINLSAQSVSITAYQSTKSHTGVNFLHTLKGGFTYGVEGSYYFPTYTGETGGKYQELATRQIGAYPEGWGVYKPYFYNTFVESRGTVSVHVGYTTNNTSITGNVGLGFNTQYWLGKDGASPITPADPAHRYFFTAKNVSPEGLIGVQVAQRVYERLWLVVGYNNVQAVQLGLRYRITPTRLFNW